jgi:hypothetical protein
VFSTPKSFALYFKRRYPLIDKNSILPSSGDQSSKKLSIERSPRAVETFRKQRVSASNRASTIDEKYNFSWGLSQWLTATLVLHTP